MASLFSSLKPQHLWAHFEEILKIPRCSKSEEAIGDYILSVAEKNGQKSKRDASGNIVILKPGSKGHEKAKTIVLQGHLDMVCEKNSNVTFDFSKDPIQAQMEGDWVTAKGTTLGADNGIGVAAALAVMEDNTLVHGPVECLFTTDEETGLNGAVGLKKSFLKGRILLNLDSEEEGAFSIGCAGGADSDIALPIVRKKSSAQKVLGISLAGLRGGHSGIDIHTGRGNAIQLLARMLYHIDVPCQLIDLEGGNKHNAIPREVTATVAVKEVNFSRIKRILRARFKEIQFEYKAVEQDMVLKLSTAVKPAHKPMDNASMEAFLGLLVGLPHGVVAMSQEIDGLVETSNNLAIVRTKKKKATVYTSSRSSVLSALEATRQKIESIAALSGAKIQHLDGYPPWTPNLQSPLLATMKTVHKKVCGKDPEVMAIHAGLECGIIGEKYSGMDMISFGPDLRNPHSPDEKVDSKSVGRFWDLLAATLKALAAS